MSLTFVAMLVVNVTVGSANDQLLSENMAPAVSGATAFAEQVEVQQHGNQWTLRTAQAERVVALENGRLVLKRFTDLTTGRELVANGITPDEFLSPAVADAEVRNGSTGGWRLIGSKQSKLSQGELQLDITLQRSALQVRKSYMLYPGSSIMREWVTFKNAGTVPLAISNPCFLNITVQLGQGSLRISCGCPAAKTIPARGSSRASR